MLVVARPAVQGVLEGDIGQAEEAVGVVADQALHDELEGITGLLQPTHVEEDLALEAVLVDGRLCSALARFVDPVQASVEVSSLASKVGEPQEGVDVVGLLRDDLLVEVVRLVELVLALVQVGLIEQNRQAKCLVATSFARLGAAVGPGIDLHLLLITRLTGLLLLMSLKLLDVAEGELERLQALLSLLSGIFCVL